MVFVPLVYPYTPEEDNLRGSHDVTHPVTVFAAESIAQTPLVHAPRPLSQL